MDHINGPITALAFVNLKSRLLILAGNGPLLQVYSQFTRKLLYSKHVFGTQSIHGITPAVTSDVKIGKDSCTQCLIWGGCSIGVIQLDSAAECENQFHLKIQDLVTEVQVEDWILNACFRPVTRSTKFDDVYGFEAVLITSHNVLLRLYIPPNSSSPDGGCVSVNRVAAGPRSILYSAHVLWPPNQRGLVAAGTVYGEVLVWSFGDYTSSRPTSPAVALHYTFQGHDGSVFGVRISEECLNSGSRSSQRLLASCSDDRTIKIWKLSLTDSLTDSLSSYSSSHTVPLKSAEADSGSHAEKESSPLATAMGHASRIWDLHFLFEADSNWHLLSLGEDSTAQIWQIQRQSHTPDDISNSVKSFLLHHHVTYKSHSGKSIWSSAVYNKTQGSRLVCTGGSDGRLVCFNLHKQRFAHLNNTFSAHWTIEKVTKDLDSLPRTSKMKLRAQSDVEKPQERIFNALEGRWKLHRILKSARPTYPSGVFDGIAVFEKRFPVDPVYDTEYLYIENGNFTTLQGLSLTATRRYVYRFNKDTNTISVWFVKSEDGSTVDYLYHELDFAALNHASPNLTVEENGSLIKAAGYHPCVDDDYHADYYFPYSCVGFDTWRLKHTVKGPQKDYIADAQYVRESTSEGLSADVNLGQGIGETPIISTVAKKPKALENSSLNADSFKTYTWINETEFLISTEQGWLLLGNSSISNENNDLTEAIDSLQVRWERIAQIQDLTSSCIPSRIPSQEMVVLAGTSGTIYLYRHHNNFISYLSKVSGKIAYLKSSILHPDSSASWPKELETFETGIVISCLGSSLIYFLGFKIATRPSTYSKILDLGLERRPGFTVTSSCYAQQKKLLILGSRNGALTFYNIYTDQNDAGNVTSSLYVDHVHGDDAVNVIEIVPTSFLETELNGIFLLTAGRDGKFAIHQIKFDIACQPGRSIEFQTMHVCTPPFGPCIEGACFDNDSHDVLLWGFRSRQFVVWNETRKTETMTVECGGSHRNWAFSPSSTNPGGGTLIWTKASACHVHSQSYTSHQVLRYGGHGREIKAMAISPPNRGMDGFTRRFLATGAEDTNIRIFDRSTDNPADFHEHFRCLAIFPQHKTGIQQLRWSSDGQRLFSAAGCEEFFVWRIRPMPCLELGFVREAQCSPITESADLRIMDFDEAEIWDKNHEGRVHAYLLSMVYSDSSVRVRPFQSLPQNPPFPTHKISKLYRSTTTPPPPPAQPSGSSPQAPTQPPASQKQPTSALAPTSSSAPPAPTAT